MSGAAWAALALGGAALLLLWRVLFVSWVELRWPRRGRMVKTSGGRVHVFAYGEGAPVLFLHGAGANSRDFWEAAELLGDGCRRLLLDRPGYGYSTAARKALPLPRQAAMAWEALDRLGVARAVLAAHGEGAAVALRMALDAPERVIGLALAAPLAFPPLRRPQLKPFGLTWLFRAVLTPLLAPVLMRARLRARFGANAPPPAFLRRAGSSLSLRPGALRSDAAAHRCLEADAAEQIARYQGIEAYTILLTADADPLADPGRNARALYQALPKAELVVTPGVGHMHHALRPHALAAAIRRLAAMEAPARPR